MNRFFQILFMTFVFIISLPSNARTIVIEPSKDIWTTSYYSYDGLSSSISVGGGLNNDELRVGGWGDEYRSLLQFDLSGVTSQVSSATLQLYSLGSPNSRHSPVSMHLDRVTNVWDWMTIPLDSGTLDNDRLWWDDRPSYQLYSASLSAPVPSSYWQTNVTNLVNGQTTGVYENYGIQLRPESTSADFNYFASAEHANEEWRPKLILELVDTTAPAIAVDVSGNGSGYVYSIDGSIHCPEVCEREYLDTSPVELYAEAEPGSVFIGWDYSGCPPNDNHCVVLLEADRTVNIKARFEPLLSLDSPRVIFIGICGAGSWGNECIEGEGWFDPRTTSIFEYFNPLNVDDLTKISESTSGIIAAGYRIGAEFQNSVVSIASFSIPNLVVPGLFRGDIIIDTQITPFYRPGDKVILVGHSLGGAVVSDVIKQLDKLGIPVELAAWIDTIGVTKIKVTKNVLNAYNFYYPTSKSDFCPIVGEAKVKVKAKTGTTMLNTAIIDPVPQGSDEGLCPLHRNMDNDKRVWLPIMEAFIEANTSLH